MFNIDSDYYTIMGIDPSINNIGVSIFYIDRHSFTINKIVTTLIDTNKLVSVKEIPSTHDNKSILLFNEFTNMLNWISPAAVAMESSFLDTKKSPLAFKSLVTAITSIKLAITKFNSYIKIYDYPPSIVKGTINTTRDNKNYVLQALTDSTYIPETYKEYLPHITEHELDAVSIGLTHYINIIKQEVICHTE